MSDAELIAWLRDQADDEHDGVRVALKMGEMADDVSDAVDRESTLRAIADRLAAITAAGDDAEPTEAALRRLGFTTSQFNDAWIVSPLSPQCLRVAYYVKSNPLWRWQLLRDDAEEPAFGLSPLKTMRQVVWLCAALSVPLNGPADSPPPVPAEVVAAADVIRLHESLAGPIEAKVMEYLSERQQNALITLADYAVAALVARHVLAPPQQEK